MLNTNKNEAIKILNSGANVFLTGNAGSGKTYLISEYARISKRNVALTATTGIAALTIGGETIHRLLKLGISTRPEMAEKIVGKWEKVKRSSKPWDRRMWQLMENLDAIVIDEASMLRRDQFELIDVILSSIYEDPRPFGGIQIILVGDLFQLPPVVSSYDLTRFRDLKEPYCFQSYLWSNADFQTITSGDS
jgi:DNA replication protein DnaC